MQRQDLDTPSGDRVTIYVELATDQREELLDVFHGKTNLDCGASVKAKEPAAAALAPDGMKPPGLPLMEERDDACDGAQQSVPMIKRKLLSP
jgi:hypothetical protein